jgi:acetolactate synthase-1/2/3 large subunit
VLRSNYPARLSIHADVPALLAELLGRARGWDSRDCGWDLEHLSGLRMDGRAEIGAACPEPQLRASPSNPGAFFDSLRQSLPRDSCVVTDSGQHQVLTTRYFAAMVPRGLVIPSDFQSMGFGISAAIGAKFACPGKPVVLVIGDGGMAMSGMELLTAVREKLNLTVVVFNDGALGQIQQQQRSEYGFAHATTLRNPDFEIFAKSMGLGFERWNACDTEMFGRAISHKGVTLIEVRAGAGAALRVQQLKGVGKSWTGSIFGEGAVRWLKRKVNKHQGKLR